MPHQLNFIPLERCLASRDLSEPQLSPNGTSVVFGSSINRVAELRIVDFSAAGAVGDTARERVLVNEPAPAVGRGFGGGCFAWLPDGSGLVFAAREGGIYEVGPSGANPRRIDTPGTDDGFNAVGVSPDARYVSVVRSVTDVVVVTRATGEKKFITQPHAFVLDPVWHNDTLYWQAWSQPHMPWDESEIWCASAPDFTARLVIKRSGSTMQQVGVSTNGTLGLLCDTNGWLTPHTFVSGELREIPMSANAIECGTPQWGVGLRTWCWSPEGTRIAVARNLNGFGDLAVVDTATGSTTTLARAVHGSVQWTRHGIVAVRSGAVTPTQIVFFHPETFERTVLATSEVTCGAGPWSQFDLVEPSLGSAPTEAGGVPFRLFAPASGCNANSTLIVWSHGGPTDQWQVTFMPRISYWVSRGCAVLVVDHRGSTGHGRAFQQALNGHWGEYDTEDLVAATRYAHEQGWGQPSTTVFMGGSAGGFASLNAAATVPPVCAGVVALYPVVDLADSAESAWHFEKHSIPVLVGASTESGVSTVSMDGEDNENLYSVRSPMSKVAELSHVKVLLLHGDMDKSVPFIHSFSLANALRRNGGNVKLEIFEGEGHGFRMRESQEREYALIGEFIAAL